jgi:transcriptional regulator with XRE-family HTH domain
MKNLRLNAGYSIRGLARAAGVSEQSIRRLERGKGVLPPTAKRIADTLGVTVTDLIPTRDNE